MKLSILTATYNRGKYLYRLYESIINNILQSNVEAEWIVIDDGSTDETKEIVEDFVSNEKKYMGDLYKKKELENRNLKNKKIVEENLEIKYFYQQNSGKMTAINKAMEFVTGDLVVDCDSDDYFSDGAFKIIEENVDKLINNQDLYALCFLKHNIDKKISRKYF